MSLPTEPATENPYASPAAPQPIAPALPPDGAVRELFLRGKNGAAWFYWIAGLSLINTILVLTHAGLSFALGLVITMIPDNIAAEIAFKPGGNKAALGGALAFDAAILGLFVLCGYLSQRRILPVFALGMVIYLLDGLLSFLLLGISDFVGLAIHAYALWSMWSGFLAYRQLNTLERHIMMSGVVTPGGV
jgi:hypothetical protein